MIDSHALFVIWIAFTIIVICAVIPFLVWAVCSGHFSKFDYASRLPLKSKIMDSTPDNDIRGQASSPQVEDNKEQNEDVST